MTVLICTDNRVAYSFIEATLQHFVLNDVYVLQINCELICKYLALNDIDYNIYTCKSLNRFYKQLVCDSLISFSSYKSKHYCTLLNNINPSKLGQVYVYWDEYI